MTEEKPILIGDVVRTSFRWGVTFGAISGAVAGIAMYLPMGVLLPFFIWWTLPVIFFTGIVLMTAAVVSSSVVLHRMHRSGESVSDASARLIGLVVSTPVALGLAAVFAREIKAMSSESFVAIAVLTVLAIVVVILPSVGAESGVLPNGKVRGLHALVLPTVLATVLIAGPLAWGLTYDESDNPASSNHVPAGEMKPIEDAIKQDGYKTVPCSEDAPPTQRCLAPITD